MIYAKHKTTGTIQTFDSIQLFKKANEILSNVYEQVDPPKTVINTVDTSYTIIERQGINPADFTIEDFKENIEIFNQKELQLFAQDTRKDIALLAKKQLKKLS
jgi:hypothetical protein